MPEVGVVKVARGTSGDCRKIDEIWGPLRPSEDLTRDWKWDDLRKSLKDLLVVTVDSSTREPIASWGSTRTSAVQLLEGNFYRLDYFEVHPAYRGAKQTAPAFVLGLVAERALEIGADGIVLSTFQVDGLVEFYTAAGAVQRCPPGWNYPANLVPLTFDGPAVERLKGFADAHLDDEEAEATEA